MSMTHYPQYEKALKLIRSEAYEQALILYNQAVEENPENPDIFNDRGVCHFHLKKLTLALADMNTALELQPDYGYRYSARAYIRSAMKDYKGALSDYEQAVKLDPEDAVAYNNLGMIQEQMGYAREAKESYEVADELDKMLKDKGISAAPVEHEPEQRESTGDTIKQVFTSKSTFKEFLQFVGRGFKLPKSE